MRHRLIGRSGAWAPGLHTTGTPVGGSCSPAADVDGGEPARMVRHSVQSKNHRRPRATRNRL